MQNRYGGTCRKCGKYVDAGYGLAINAGGKWVVEHTTCPEIASGLGIGGIGSDDYNSRTETGHGTAPVYPNRGKMVRCSCGHTVPANQVMSASLGTACPDCYDRMESEY